MGADLHVIAELEKNRTERVRVALDRWRDVDLIDIRATVLLTETSGQWTPTKKGLSLRIGQLPALIEALQLAEAKARSLGLLETGGAGAA